MESFATKVPEAAQMILSRISSLSVLDAVISFTAVFAFIKLMRMSRRRVRTPKLRGPASPSFLYGVGKLLLQADEPASIYESWVQEYGPIYEIPSTLGSRRIILYDPKAIAHFHAKESWTYVRTPMVKKALEVGVSIHFFRLRLSYLMLMINYSLDEVCFGPMEKATEGMSLNSLCRRGINRRVRQRRSLTPAFSIAAIRKLTPIFYDSAHKVLFWFLEHLCPPH